MNKKRKPKFKYIHDPINFSHYYIFNSRKEVNMFCDMNNLEDVGNCGGCTFMVTDPKGKYHNRVIIFYSDDGSLVHEILHAVAYLNQHKWRLLFDVKTSEPIAYNTAWLYDEAKTGRGRAQHKKCSGWEPTDAFACGL